MGMPFRKKGEEGETAVEGDNFAQEQNSKQQTIKK
jgi:hypothetical protein